MTNSKAKGKRGELEVVQLIKEHTGIEAHRNWLEQSAQGGVDIVGVPGWAIEVKRQKKWLGKWWTQAAQQAKDGNKPVLLYKLDRKPWRAQVCSCALGSELHFMVTTDILNWLHLVRHERLGKAVLQVRDTQAHL